MNEESRCLSCENLLTLLILLIVLNGTAMAQGDDPGLPGNDPDVPLDGDVGLLLAAGVVYGIKRYANLNRDAFFS